MEIDERPVPKSVIEGFVGLADAIEPAKIMMAGRENPWLFNGHRTIPKNVPVACAHIKSIIRSERHLKPMDASCIAICIVNINHKVRIAVILLGAGCWLIAENNWNNATYTPHSTGFSRWNERSSSSTSGTARCARLTRAAMPDSASPPPESPPVSSWLFP